MAGLYRASILHCLGDPGEQSDTGSYEYFADGLLVVENGHVVAVGDVAELLQGEYDDAEIIDYRDKLIVPGFIDCHVHFPQVDIIGSYGAQLLDWLNDYAYPGEAKFADADYANDVAAIFIDQLLRNGTTTALVFATVHAHSVDAILGAARDQDMRLIAGKVLMDRDCPEDLRDTPQSAYDESKALIERWHGQGRLGYAITPRFALTSSAEQLEATGKLAAEHPDVWVQTHLAENHDEVREIAKRFPDRKSYLDVYDHFGLLRERSVFAHCLHLSDDDRDRLGKSGAAAAFCPTSNLFLGSGLFDLRAMTDAGVMVGLATDVGGGTSLSMLKTMAEAYKVLQLNGQSLPASRALYLATLGAARSLRIDDKVGNFEIGKEADFVILDAEATELSARRAASATSIEEQLFAMIVLGDDRLVAATYVHGCRRMG